VEALLWIVGIKPKIKDFIWGGTPTFFLPEFNARLMHGILRLPPNAENYNLVLKASDNTIPRTLTIPLSNVSFRRVSYGVQD